MKRLLTIALLVCFAFRCPAPQESDLVAGIDPTGYSSITAANLLMLVSNGTIGQTNKGAIIRGPTTPDTVNNRRYTNFIWLDTSLGLPGILKQWGGSSWVSATIGYQGVLSTNIANGAVGQAQLGTNAVATINIQNNAVDNTKIGAGQILSTHIADGAVSNRHLADQTIQGAKLAYNTIQGTNIADASVNGTKLVAQSVTGTQLGIGSVGNLTLATNAIASSNIMAGAVGQPQLAANAVRTNNIAITGGTAYQVLQIDPSASFIQWGTLPFPRLSSMDGGLVGAVAFGVTNAHGLGGRPSLVMVTLTNLVAELGYSTGDEIPFQQHYDGASSSTVAFDDTNVYVLIETALPEIANRVLASGPARITANRWGLKIRAYR